MSFNIINSETVKMDGKDMVFLRESRAVLKDIEKMIEKVGSVKFFSSPYDEVKKVRESMAALFFLLTLQKYNSERHLFLMQPQQDPPDFIITGIKNHFDDMTMDAFELVEIPIRCETFEDMLDIVQKKIDKGYPQGAYQLLIFINHTKSKEWISLLDQHLKDHKPFKAVYTINLLTDNQEYWQPLVHKLRPEPKGQYQTKLSDIKFPTRIPDCMEERYEGGMRVLAFKPKAIAEFIKKARREILDRKKEIKN